MTCTDSMIDYRANHCSAHEAPRHVHDVLALFGQMPGAPNIPRLASGTVDWDRLMETEHWHFCECIVDTIQVSISKATGRTK